MLRAVALGSLLSLIVLAGCSRDRVGTSVTTSAPRAAAPSALEEAVRLLGQEDFKAAEAQYRVALRQAPEDVAVHYGLGTVLSHLDRLDEAREQFEWVVKHAGRDREEVALSQRWLAQLGSAEPADADEDTEGTTTEPGATTTAGAVGSMKGATRWPGITPEGRPTTLELSLVREGTTAPATPLKLSIRLGSQYRFSKVPAGTYALVGQADGRDLWKRKVIVAPDVETTVDLTPETSLLGPDQFPGPASS